MYHLKQSTAITIPVFVHDGSGDGVTGIADGTFTKRISKDGGVFAAMTVTIAEMENGWYSLPLSSSHTDTLGVLSISLSGGGGTKRTNLQWRVNARIPDDMAFPTVTGRSLNVSAGGVGDADAVMISNDATAADALETMLDGTGGNVLNLKQLNVTNSTGTAIIAYSTGSNGYGIDAQGNGISPGIQGTGGATGAGIIGSGGSVSGAGFFGLAASGNGMLLTGGVNGPGMRIVGAGTGAGMLIEGGNTGYGLSCIGGAASGDGARFESLVSGNGLTLLSGGGDGHGLLSTGNGTGEGGRFVAGATGNGLEAVGGSSTGHGIVGTVTAGVQIGVGLYRGTAQAGGASTITLDAGASATDDLYNGLLVSITTGTGAIQTRTITDYVGSTKVATVSSAWATNPASGSVFELFPSSASMSSGSAETIADAVWDELRADHVIAGSFGQYVLADTILISGDSTAADNFETMLDGTGGQTLSLGKLNVVNSAGDAIVASSTGSNGHGINASGNGTGSGIAGTGGATGHGFNGTGGATSGDGANFSTPVSGDGIMATGAGTGHGIVGVGGGSNGSGIRGAAAGSAPGIVGIGAGASGHGILGTGGATGTSGIRGAGSGSGPGISGLGGSTAGAPGASFQAGAGGGHGLLVTGVLTGSGFSSVGGATGAAILVTGGSTSGNGISITTTAGDGVSVLPTAGHGIITTANGTSKHGIVSTGGTAGVSDGVNCVAGTGGVDLRADITGDVTGNVVGNVTGTVNNVLAATNITSTGTPTFTQTGDSFLRLGVPAGASVSADIAAIQDNLPIKITKNTALANFEFFMVDSTDHVTGKTGLTITATRSIDGGLFAACTNAAAEVENGMYKIDLSAADLNGNVITFRFIGTGADARLITVVTQLA